MIGGLLINLRWDQNQFFYCSNNHGKRMYRYSLTFPLPAENSLVVHGAKLSECCSSIAQAYTVSDRPQEITAPSDRQNKHKTGVMEVELSCNMAHDWDCTFFPPINIWILLLGEKCNIPTIIFLLCIQFIHT